MATISAIIMAENQDSLDTNNFVAKKDPQILTNILLNEILDALNQLSKKLDNLHVAANREKRSAHHNVNLAVKKNTYNKYCIRTCQ